MRKPVGSEPDVRQLGVSATPVAEVAQVGKGAHRARRRAVELDVDIAVAASAVFSSTCVPAAEARLAQAQASAITARRKEVG
jgi:hypothetical protein